MQTPQELELDQDREELQSYLLDHPDDFVTHILQFNEMLARYRAASQEITHRVHSNAHQAARQHCGEDEGPRHGYHTGVHRKGAERHSRHPRCLLLY